MTNSLSGHVVGFIGLGLMGRPMAMNLHAAGADVVIHNRSRAVVDALAAEGLSPAHSPREVAGRAPVVIVMATDTPAVERIVGAEDGIADGIAPDGLAIDMGTTAVEATRALARTIEGRGAHFVDAPVSGGEIGAKAGTLTIMAGGSEAAVAQAMPCFEVMGASTTRVGDVGAGQIAKAANQVIVGLTIGAVAEALALARRAGADAIYPELAERHGALLYPFLLEGVATVAALNQADGLHPNEAGVEVIVERILPSVLCLAIGTLHPAARLATEPTGCADG